jgi:hypothetical protein
MVEKKNGTSSFGSPATGRGGNLASLASNISQRASHPCKFLFLPFAKESTSISLTFINSTSFPPYKLFLQN